MNADLCIGVHVDDMLAVGPCEVTKKLLGSTFEGHDNALAYGIGQTTRIFGSLTDAVFCRTTMGRVQNIVAHQNTASDSIMFTITLPINMLMKFGKTCQHVVLNTLKSGDEVICLKETCGPYEGRAEQHYHITVRWMSNQRGILR